MNCPRCDTNIDEHPANKCMDAWIAEAVMKWIPDYGYMDGDIPYFNKDTFGTSGVSWDRARKWSLFIKEAWELVEKIAQTNYVDIGVDEHGAQVQIDAFQDDRWELGFVESTRAGTAPLAICRAALIWMSKCQSSNS